MGNVLTLLVIIAILVIGWWIRGVWGRFWSTEPNTSSSTVVSFIQDASELVTLKSYFQQIITDKPVMTRFFMEFKSRILLICKGKIECRFDMSKANITVNEAEVRVVMPVCEFRPIITQEDVEVYDIDISWWDPLNKDEVLLKSVLGLITNEGQNMAQRANEELHLVDQAKANAKLYIENLAKNFGYTAYVSFEDDNHATAKPEPKALQEGSSSVIELEASPEKAAVH